MGITKTQITAALSPPLPQEIVEHLLNEYQDIKQHFAFHKFRPNELNGGRFAECIIRLLQHLDSPPHTPFGSSLTQTEQLFRRIESNTNLHESLRFFIPKLARILLDIRNRRDVAHVGGDVSPNFSDSLFVTHTADWIVTEILRIYYSGSIDSAKKIVESINEIQVPIVTDVNGFVRVQNTKLDVSSKVLVILYFKSPTPVLDKSLINWTRYSNSSRFKNDVLGRLDKDALIHYESGLCTILPKGIVFTEKNINMDVFS